MLAVVPVRDGVLPAGASEAAAECGHRSVVIGSGTAEAAAALGGSIRRCEVGPYRPAAWAAALAPMIDGDDLLVLPASPDGRDLAPRLAVLLDRPMFAGAIQVNGATITVPRGGGVSMRTFITPPSCVATLQVGARGVDHRVVAPEIEVLELSLPDDLPDPVVESVAPPDPATIDLAEASRIVGGGAGLHGPEQFDQLHELGARLGASVGATRVITDRGWVGHERQIGTTGVVVDPRLYLAFGISGAVQHTSGLGAPDHIISVNTDAHCPMMQLADLAVVADANAVLAELLEIVSAVDG